MSQATQPQNEFSSDQDLAKKKKASAGWILFRVIVVAVIILALIYFIPLYLHFLSHASTDDAFIDGHILSISPRVAGHVKQVYVKDNQPVKAGDLLVELDPQDCQTRLDSALAALAQAEAAEESKRLQIDLTTVSTNAGLDNAQANVQAALAAVDAATAQFSAAVSMREQAKAQLAYAEAALKQAKADAKSDEAKQKQAAADLHRYEEMSKTQTVSEQDLDHAKTAEQIAAAGLDASQQKIQTQQALVKESQAALQAAIDNLQKAKSQIKASEAQLVQAKAHLTEAESAPIQVKQSQAQAEAAAAAVNKAKAEVEQARLNLSYTRIVAQRDGHVTKKNVEPGNYVQVGQALMALVTNDLWVIANFKETQLTKMQTGQPVEVLVDTYPSVKLHGVVQSIQRGTGARFSLLPPENATGNYVKVVQRVPVKIIFTSPDELKNIFLAPGMSVVPEVNISVAGIKNASMAVSQRANEGTDSL